MRIENFGKLAKKIEGLLLLINDSLECRLASLGYGFNVN